MYIARGRERERSGFGLASLGGRGGSPLRENWPDLSGDDFYCSSPTVSSSRANFLRVSRRGCHPRFRGDNPGGMILAPFVRRPVSLARFSPLSTKYSVKSVVIGIVSRAERIRHLRGMNEWASNHRRDSLAGDGYKLTHRCFVADWNAGHDHRALVSSGLFSVS